MAKTSRFAAEVPKSDTLLGRRSSCWQRFCPPSRSSPQKHHTQSEQGRYSRFWNGCGVEVEFGQLESLAAIAGGGKTDFEGVSGVVRNEQAGEVIAFPIRSTGCGIVDHRNRRENEAAVGDVFDFDGRGKADPTAGVCPKIEAEEIAIIGDIGGEYELSGER